MFYEISKVEISMKYDVKAHIFLSYSLLNSDHCFQNLSHLLKVNFT